MPRAVHRTLAGDTAFRFGGDAQRRTQANPAPSAAADVAATVSAAANANETGWTRPEPPPAPRSRPTGWSWWTAAALAAVVATPAFLCAVGYAGWLAWPGDADVGAGAPPVQQAALPSVILPRVSPPTPPASLRQEAPALVRPRPVLRQSPVPAPPMRQVAAPSRLTASLPAALTPVLARPRPVLRQPPVPAPPMRQPAAPSRLATLLPVALRPAPARPRPVLRQPPIPARPMRGVAAPPRLTASLPAPPPAEDAARCCQVPVERLARGAESLGLYAVATLDQVRPDRLLPRPDLGSTQLAALLAAVPLPAIPESGNALAIPAPVAPVPPAPVRAASTPASPPAMPPASPALALAIPSPAVPASHTRPVLPQAGTPQPLPSIGKGSDRPDRILADLGQTRVLLRYAAGRGGDRLAAVSRALRQRGTELTVHADLPASASSNVVRYYYETDRAAAERIAMAIGATRVSRQAQARRSVLEIPGQLEVSLAH